MAKIARIIVENGMIGIARPGDRATYEVTDLPAGVEPYDVLVELAIFEAGRVPKGIMTYEDMRSEIDRGMNAWKPRP
jgi:hypothetical protein